MIVNDGDDRSYQVIGNLTIDVTYGRTDVPGSSHGFHITASYDGVPVRRPVNRCECCGRYDLEEVVARSFVEAVELGWLRKMTP